MGITPWKRGQTTPYGSWTLVDDSGNVLPGLSSLVPSNFTLVIRDKAKVLPDRNGAGTFSVLNAATGLVQYAWSPNDSLQTGHFELYVKVTYPTGPEWCGPNDWTVD